MEILTDEDIGGLEWGETPGKSYFADFRFVDKYPKEVNCLLEAQNRKTLERVIKDLIQNPVSPRRGEEMTLENLIPTFEVGERVTKGGK